MRNLKRLLLGVLLCGLTVGLVWAAAELMGQANKSAADAGSNAADMEMVSLDMIKPSASSPSCDWQLEKKLKGQLDQNTVVYKKVLGQAQGEIAGSGAVSEATRNKGMKLAEDFMKISGQYADMWEKCNGITRAKLAREAGASRFASADMAFNNVDSEKIDAYNKQQSALRDARSAYVAEAKQDMKPEDRAALTSSLLPKAQTLLSSVMQLTDNVRMLLKQIQDQASSPIAMAGCAKQAVSAATSGDNPATVLLMPVKSLFSLTGSMLGNVKSLISDIQSLS